MCGLQVIQLPSYILHAGALCQFHTVYFGAQDNYLVHLLLLIMITNINLFFIVSVIHP